MRRERLAPALLAMFFLTGCRSARVARPRTRRLDSVQHRRNNRSPGLVISTDVRELECEVSTGRPPGGRKDVTPRRLAITALNPICGALRHAIPQLIVSHGTFAPDTVEFGSCSTR
jgi:hypothetical protein